MAVAGALHLIVARPFLSMLPHHHQLLHPAERKLLYTLLSLFISLVCTHLPLYGAASNRPGTLMDLGITPIVASGLVMRLLQKTKIIQPPVQECCKTHCSRDEVEVVADAAGARRKLLLGVVITIAQAVAYVLSGRYGHVVRDLGAGNAILIILQLFFAGTILISLDQLLQKGYGLGGSAGISKLFTATSICEKIIWQAFSPSRIHTASCGRGPEFQGALPALFHLLINRPSKVAALREAFHRPHLPNLTSLSATLLLLCLLLHFLQQGSRINSVPSSTGGRQQHPQHQHQHQGSTTSNPNYMSKALFFFCCCYNSNLPILLQPALSIASKLHFISQLLHNKYGTTCFIVNLLGKWSGATATAAAANSTSAGRQLIPVGGLVYYISPPASLAQILSNPSSALFYFLFMLTACAIFSANTCRIEDPRLSSYALASSSCKPLRKDHQQIVPVLPDYLYTPATAAAFGGICFAALTVVADFLGAFGSGRGILLAGTIIYQCLQTFHEERASHRG